MSILLEAHFVFPQDARAAEEVENAKIPRGFVLERESLNLQQTLELRRAIMKRAPQFKLHESGTKIDAAEIKNLLPAIAELRKNTAHKEFGRLLDRVHAKATKSRKRGLPIWLLQGTTRS